MKSMLMKLDSTSLCGVRRLEGFGDGGGQSNGDTRPWLGATNVMFQGAADESTVMDFQPGGNEGPRVQEVLL